MDRKRPDKKSEDTKKLIQISKSSGLANAEFKGFFKFTQTEMKSERAHPRFQTSDLKNSHSQIKKFTTFICSLSLYS